MSFLDKPSWNMMERSLDASTLRQKVVANNIANVDTPNFKRSDVSFEELLHNQMSAATPSIEGYRTDPRHFVIGNTNTELPNSEIKTDESTAVNTNNNNVDMDYEMSLMAKNQLKYNAMIQQMNSEFKKMRTVIGGK
ncbi:flagellar basal-body rod protein FlgB [Paenibacillus pectinilyticus]|uniref:Flagellar basal body rod protein FlgB n=1 Tax=Paenibacillus pectinilyticus TaxID=512399 RepID=A0A1C1A0B0_9BACL|nr:flagellar basal body rod protein FlgB [Paenibacillus pectinilyticus]OCT13822.1 flagellar basal-body rod protein FlgB [Paenibacillus pectinilyticus]